MAQKDHDAIVDIFFYRLIKRFKKAFSLFLVGSFLLEQAVFAAPIQPIEFGPLVQNAFISSFVPANFKFLSVNPANPHNYFNFLLDKGEGKLASLILNKEAKQLLNYFFVGLTIPNKDFWVNLNPGQPDKIIPESLSKTDLGKILLEADLLLKKNAARITHPKHSIGREYWNRLNQKFGAKSKDITMQNRLWIVPDKAELWQTKDAVMIVSSSLKVMLENEYLKTAAKDEVQAYINSQVKELIIPQLTKEVNSSKSFAQLRQVYNSLILAQWYKQNYSRLITPNSQLIDQGITPELQSRIPWSAQDLWQQYVKSFKEGDYSWEEYVGDTQEAYVSGGVMLIDIDTPEVVTYVSSPIASSAIAGQESNLIYIQTNGDKSNPVIAEAFHQYNPSAASPIKAEGEVITQKDLPEAYWNDILARRAKEMTEIAKNLAAEVKAGKIAAQQRQDALKKIAKQAISDMAEELSKKHNRDAAAIKSELQALLGKIDVGSEQQHFANAMVAFQAEQAGDNYDSVSFPRDAGLIFTGENGLMLLTGKKKNPKLFYISGSNPTFSAYYSSMKTMIAKANDQVESFEDFLDKLAQIIEEEMNNDSSFKFKKKINDIQTQMKGSGILDLKEICFVDSGYQTFPLMFAALVRMMDKKKEIKLKALVKEKSSTIKATVLQQLDVNKWREEVKKVILASQAAKFATPYLGDAEKATGFLWHPFVAGDSDGVLRMVSPVEQLRAFWIQVCFELGAINYYDIFNGLMNELVEKGINPQDAEQLTHEAVNDVMGSVNVPASKDTKWAGVSAMVTPVKEKGQESKKKEKIAVVSDDVEIESAAPKPSEVVANIEKSLNDNLTPVEMPAKTPTEVQDWIGNMWEKARNVQSPKNLADAEKYINDRFGLALDFMKKHLEGNKGIEKKVAEEIVKGIEENAKRALLVLRMRLKKAESEGKPQPATPSIQLSEGTKKQLEDLAESKQKGIDGPVIARHNNKVRGDKQKQGPSQPLKPATRKVTFVDGAVAILRETLHDASRQYNDKMNQLGFIRRFFYRFAAIGIKIINAVKRGRKFSDAVNNGGAVDPELASKYDAASFGSDSGGLLAEVASRRLDRAGDQAPVSLDSIIRNPAESARIKDLIMQLFVDYIKGTITDDQFEQRARKDILPLIRSGTKTDTIGSNLLKIAKGLRAEYVAQGKASNITKEDISDIEIQFARPTHVYAQELRPQGRWERLTVKMVDWAQRSPLRRVPILGLLTSPFFVGITMSILGQGFIIAARYGTLAAGTAAVGVTGILFPVIGLAPVVVILLTVGVVTIIAGVRQNAEVWRNRGLLEIDDVFGLRSSKPTSIETEMLDKNIPLSKIKVEGAIAALRRLISAYQANPSPQSQRKLIVLIGNILARVEYGDEIGAEFFKYNSAAKGLETRKTELFDALGEAIGILTPAVPNITNEINNIKAKARSTFEKSYNRKLSSFKQIKWERVRKTMVWAAFFGLVTSTVAPIIISWLYHVIGDWFGWFTHTTTIAGSTKSVTGTPLLSDFITTHISGINRITQEEVSTALNSAGVARVDIVLQELFKGKTTIDPAALMHRLAEDGTDQKLAEGLKQLLETRLGVTLNFGDYAAPAFHHEVDTALNNHGVNPNAFENNVRNTTDGGWSIWDTLKQFIHRNAPTKSAETELLQAIHNNPALHENLMDLVRQHLLNDPNAVKRIVEDAILNDQNVANTLHRYATASGGYMLDKTNFTAFADAVRQAYTSAKPTTDQEWITFGDKVIELLNAKVPNIADRVNILADFIHRVAGWKPGVGKGMATDDLKNLLFDTYRKLLNVTETTITPPLTTTVTTEPGIHLAPVITGAKWEGLGPIGKPAEGKASEEKPLPTGPVAPEDVMPLALDKVPAAEGKVTEKTPASVEAKSEGEKPAGEQDKTPKATPENTSQILASALSKKPIPWLHALTKRLGQPKANKPANKSGIIEKAAEFLRVTFSRLIGLFTVKSVWQLIKQPGFFSNKKNENKETPQPPTAVSDTVAKPVVEESIKDIAGQERPSGEQGAPAIEKTPPAAPASQEAGEQKTPPAKKEIVAKKPSKLQSKKDKLQQLRESLGLPANTPNSIMSLLNNMHTKAKTPGEVRNRVADVRTLLYGKEGEGLNLEQRAKVIDIVEKYAEGEINRIKQGSEPSESKSGSAPESTPVPQPESKPEEARKAGQARLEKEAADKKAAADQAHKLVVSEITPPADAVAAKSFEPIEASRSIIGGKGRLVVKRNETGELEYFVESQKGIRTRVDKKDLISMGFNLSDIEAAEKEIQGSKPGSSPVAPGGIDLGAINLNVEDCTKVFSANPVDDKILRAAEMLKRNWNAVSVLYLQEAMLLLKYDIVKDFSQRALAIQLLGMLKANEQLDENSLEFLNILQAGRPIEELKLAFVEN